MLGPEGVVQDRQRYRVRVGYDFIPSRDRVRKQFSKMFSVEMWTTLVVDSVLWGV